MVAGDLKTKFSIQGMVGEWGVPSVNDGGGRLVEVCPGREPVISYTHFRKNEICKYTQVREITGDKSFID